MIIMSKVKSDPYYAKLYLNKEIDMQRKDTNNNLTIEEIEKNIKDRSLIRANGLIKSRIDKNRLKHDDIEGKEIIIKEITDKYIATYYDNIKFKEYLKTLKKIDS
jgi:hypothetical protein